MPRYAVRVFYDGANYRGYQPQPGKVTVAGEIMRALTSSGLIQEPRTARFQSASRTDRGVSALRQTIAFTTTEAFSTMRINAHLPPDIWAWAWSAVSEAFNPRRDALMRHYVYVAPNEGEDINRMREAARLMGEHRDFRGLVGGRGEPCTLRLEGVGVEVKTRYVLFSLRARSFFRGAVRHIVAAILAVGKGTVGLDALSSALTRPGSVALRLRPAPPEGLMLFDVDYNNVKFEVDPASAAGLKRFLLEKLMKAEVFGISLRALESGPATL